MYSRCSLSKVNIYYNARLVSVAHTGSITVYRHRHISHKYFNGMLTYLYQNYLITFSNKIYFTIYIREMYKQLALYKKIHVNNFCIDQCSSIQKNRIGQSYRSTLLGD
jgi:hypothetical protein